MENQEQVGTDQHPNAKSKHWPIYRNKKNKLYKQCRIQKKVLNAGKREDENEIDEQNQQLFRKLTECSKSEDCSAIL